MNNFLIFSALVTLSQQQTSACTISMAGVDAVIMSSSPVSEFDICQILRAKRTLVSLPVCRRIVIARNLQREGLFVAARIDSSAIGVKVIPYFNNALAGSPCEMSIARTPPLTFLWFTSEAGAIFLAAVMGFLSLLYLHTKSRSDSADAVRERWRHRFLEEVDSFVANGGTKFPSPSFESEIGPIYKALELKMRVENFVRTYTKEGMTGELTIAHLTDEQRKLMKAAIVSDI